MKNKLLISLFIFISLFCFCSVCYALTESSGNVRAKYFKKNGSVFYSETLIQNNEINITLEDRIISVISNDLKDNGVSVVLVPVKTSAFDWLTNNMNNKSNIRAYYIDFYKGNEKISLNGKLNLKIKSCDVCDLEKVYYYDSSKNLLNKSNNVNNNLNLSINKSGYLLFSNNILRTINYTVEDHGDLVFENKSYSDNGKIYSDTPSKEIVIRPNSGYLIDKVLLNNIDITNQVSGNYIVLNLNNINDLDISFKKSQEISINEKYHLTGAITVNNVPLSNVKVKLHNSSLVTYTDEFGNFKFDNVEPGNHTMSIEDGSRVIGYSKFEIIVNERVGTEIVLDNNVVEISINKNSSIINFNLDLDDDLRVNYINVYTIIKGDINCDGLVNVTDLVQLRMFLAGIKNLTDKGLIAANLKVDQKIDITDLIKLRRYLAGLEEL